MPQTEHDRVIALAGLFQAAALVNDIAREGQMSSQAFEVSIASLFKIDAMSTEEVFGGGLDGLRIGLRQLMAQLSNPDNREITRYVIALLVLERKLAKRPHFLSQIGQGIRAASERLQYFPMTHANIVASLAEIYSSTISPLSPRILVNGNQIHLTNPENANRIRALLLAGIRAARLWRQSGGGRLTLMLRRKSLLRETQRTLTTLEHGQQASTQ